jgi:hypothetical protein
MKKYKFVKILILVLLLIGVYSGFKIYSAKNNFDTIDSYDQIQVNMNSQIIWDNTSKNSISIESSDNQPVEAYVFLSPDKKSIFINPPIHGFLDNNRYYITISKKIHLKGEQLKKDKTEKFKISKDETMKIPKKVKREPKYGDIIGTSDEFMGYKYEHYAVYIGNNRIIHYCSKNGKVEDTKIQETDMYPYFKPGKFFVLDFGNSSKFNSFQTVKRAASRLGEKSYNLLQNNCEHFAVWKTGDSRSYQLEKLSDQDIAKVKLFISMGINLQ